ncbi:hypothetical protein BKA56DRAFT_234957 [Ilyonectria sp. MPI-CAGE-AT-0026]|nr:hypothetical protein BKA56DRAFT_234957 [Ilyonectria sp. MPI-CAGE-AT-0026]
MQYPRADHESVYCSCRRVFSIHKNATLRKQKAIETIVRRHSLSVSNISNQKLIQILQYLLKEGIFGSIAKARSTFPRLFLPYITPQAHEVPKPPSRQAFIMEEHIRLITTGIYSDLKLISALRTYAAHRAVVCLQSPVISKSCQYQDANLVRSSDCGTHASINSFNFQDDDPLSVDCVVQYFYQSDYVTTYSAFGLDVGIGAVHEEKEGVPDARPDNGFDMVLHVKVYALAEQYDIPLLKALSLKKFEEAAQDHWRSPYLLDALREAYTSTIEEDRGMRAAGVKILHTRRELMDEGNVRELLKELPQLTFDQLMYFLDMSRPNNFSIAFRG